MKKLRFNHIFLTLVAALALFTVSCTEDGENLTGSLNTEFDIVQDDATFDAEFDAIDYEVQRVMNADDGGRGAAGTGERQEDPCATVTVDRDNRTVTVDFGEENCEGLDGKLRRGKIIITHTGRFRDQDATTTVTFEGFFVNDHQVEGTRTIENLGPNEEGYLQQRITLTGGKITAPDGKFISREATWTRTWIRGNNPSEDEYLHEGSASGVNRRGIDYNVEITEPLKRKRACFRERIPFPVEGVKSITATNSEGETFTRTIDYGDGECDDLVMVTRNGEGPFEVKLRR